MFIGWKMGKSNVVDSYTRMSGNQCSMSIFMFLDSLSFQAKEIGMPQKLFCSPDSFAPHVANVLDLEPRVPIQRIIKLTSSRAKCLQSREGTFPSAFLREFIYFPKYLFTLGKLGSSLSYFITLAREQKGKPSTEETYLQHI